MEYCKRCCKALTDPVSIDDGMGPICRSQAKNEQAQERTTDMFGHADFEYHIIDGTLVIYDLNEGARSVTNDIEYVLASIQNDQPASFQTVIYQDSMGIFDGVRINSKGEFVTFYPIREKVLDKALANISAGLH